VYQAGCNSRIASHIDALFDAIRRWLAKSGRSSAPLILLESGPSPVTVRPRSLALNKAGVSKTMGQNVEGGGMPERLLDGLLGDEQEMRDAEPTETL